jgi:hypothetical protein
MSYILAIAPGNLNSAVAILDKEYYCSDKHDILDNHELLAQIRFGYSGPNSLLPFYCPDTIVIERITGYNMGVRQTAFDAHIWIGRFIEAARTVDCNTYHRPPTVVLLPQSEIKLHLCGSTRAKDKDIIAALADRFAPGKKDNGKGTKDNPGWFYGFRAGIWSAYAVGVTYLDWLIDKRILKNNKIEIIKFGEEEI